EVHGRVSLRRPPHGHDRFDRRRSLNPVPRRQEYPEPDQSAPPTAAADQQNAHDRGVRLSPQPGPALRLPGPGPLLYGELHEHALAPRRAEVSAESGIV